MSAKRLSMNRRQVLRSAAASLWLPVLPSALSRQARAAGVSEPKRLMIYFIANGLSIGLSGSGSDYDPDALLASLDPMASRKLVVTGLENKTVGRYSDHEPCTPALLSDVAPSNYFNGPFDCGVTCDQIAAAQVGGETPFPSMQLGAATAFEPISPHGRTYSARISWASPETPLPPTESPRQLFDSMFGGFDPDATAEDLERRAAMRLSVLDSVLDQVQGLESTLNNDDRAKLDQYTTGVRELEQRLEALEESTCPIPDQPASQLPFKETVEAMADLMVVALQCDYTRIMTFMSSPSSSYIVYDWLGISTNHHVLSHGFNNNSQRRQLFDIQRYQTAVFASVCERLQETITSDGQDLLSHTLAVLTSEFTEPDIHSSHPLPFVLMGGEAGGVQSGRQMAYSGDPHSNLLRSMISFTGADATGFGPNATSEIDLSS